MQSPKLKGKKAFDRNSYLSICFPGFIEALTIDTLMRHWVKTLTNCFDVFCYLAFCSWYDVICFLKHPLVAIPYHYGRNIKKSSKNDWAILHSKSLNCDSIPL